MIPGAPLAPPPPPGGQPPPAPQQQGPMPLGLLPGMESVSPGDNLPIGLPGGPVNADESVGLNPENGIGINVDPTDPENEGLPGHRLEKMFREFETVKARERREMLRAEMYYHGHQWTEQQKNVLATRAQPATYFNELRKKIDSYVGIIERLRRDPKAYPTTPAHDVDTDVVTAVLRHVDDVTNGPMRYSEAGRDYFVDGIGAIWCGVKRTARGEIVHDMREVPVDTFLYDPRSEKYDFSDAKYLGEYRIMDIEDARELLTKLGRPDQAQRLEGLINYSEGSFDSLTPEWHRLDTSWWNKERSTLRLVHMYYRYRGQWRCTIFTGSVKLYDAPSIYVTEEGESTQPFMAASCNVDYDGTRYGVVRDLIPIQDAINHRWSKLLWMLTVRQVIMEESAVEDIEAVRREIMRPDGVIKLRPGKEGNILHRFQVATQDQEIAGNVQLLQAAIAQMQNYGPNSALLGKNDSEQQSGRAILARQNAGMTEMSPAFGRHRELKLRTYRRNWELCRQFWTTERFIRLTDDDKGVKFAALNRRVLDPATGQIVGVENDIARMWVDIIIDEGPDVIVMQEELLNVLSQSAGASPQLQKILISLSGVPNKEILLKMLDEANAPPPEVMELQQRMATLEQLLKAAEVEKKLAEADKTRAQTVVDAFEKGLDMSVIGQQFPLVYRETPFAQGFMEGLLQRQQQPAQQMPPNGFGQPDQQPANDNRGMMTPPAWQPGQEPQFGQPGALPVSQMQQGMA